MSRTRRNRAALSSLDQIRRQADSYPALTRDAERSLAHQARAGDDRARESLVGSHLRLVIEIATSIRWVDPGLGLEDLIQEGALGLDIAARRFDPERNVRFATFARPYVRGQMFRGIAASGRAIRLPVHVERQLVAYKRKKTALAERFEREPSLSEIADFLMLDDAQVNEYEILALRTISIDERYLGRDGTLEPLPQGLEVDSEPKQPAALEREQEYARLRDAVYALKEPHQSVIRYRFLTDSKPPTHAEIGRKLVPPRSRQRVQRIEVEALARLRDALTPLGTARRGGR